MTASTAKILSSPRASLARTAPARSVRAPAPRARWGFLALLREAIGGALLLAAWIALWTVTWAAVAGPLSPASDAGAARARAAIVEGT